MSKSEPNIEIERGDVFQTPDGPIKVISGQSGDEVRVTDPTISDPIHSRAGRWRVNVDQLQSDIESGTVERANLSVVTDDE
jgi:hypothetical protein